MVMKVNCSLCANPECNGKEFTVKYDYMHGARRMGSRVVCSSQVFKQGNEFKHTIVEDGKFHHTFTAVPVQEDDRAIGEMRPPEKITPPIDENIPTPPPRTGPMAGPVTMGPPEEKSNAQEVKDERTSETDVDEDTGIPAPGNGEDPERETTPPRTEAGVHSESNPGQGGQAE